MATTETSGLRGAAELMWRRIPDLAGRLSPTLRAVLRDGDYVYAWPGVAVAVPPVMLLTGLVLGAVHPGPVFSSSVLVLLLLSAVSGLGAAYGLLVLAGYAVGDLLLHSHDALGYYYYGSSPLTRLLRTDLALLDSYLVLAGLLVVAPIMAMATARQTQRLLGRGGPGQVVGYLVAALVQALLAYFWAQAAAFLIRPLWSFSGSTPDIGSINPLQQDAVWLAVVAAIAVAARAVLTLQGTRAAVRRPGPPYVRFTMRKPWPWPIGVALRAAVFTLLLAGLIGSLLGAVLLFAVLAGLGSVQYGAVPLLPGYVRVIAKVPLVLRVAACCLIGYLMSGLVVQPALNTGGSSFVPMLVAVVPPLLLAAVLMPGQPRPGRVTR